MPYCNALFYRRYDGGAGASSHPTILLHGLGGSHLSWPPQLRRLPGQTIYALDLPGHGQSIENTCIDMDCYIAALKHFFKCMRFEQINLVGHSMGAMIAYAYASENPDQIHSLALLSMGISAPYARQLELGFIRERTRSQAITILQRYGFHPSFPNHARKRLLDPLYQTRLSLLHADAMVCANFNAHAYAQASNYPILLITGTEDELVPLSGVRILLCQNANAELKPIDDCGHFVIYEKPEITSHHLRQFLGRQKE